VPLLLEKTVCFPSPFSRDGYRGVPRMYGHPAPLRGTQFPMRHGVFFRPFISVEGAGTQGYGVFVQTSPPPCSFVKFSSWLPLFLNSCRNEGLNLVFFFKYEFQKGCSSDMTGLVEFNFLFPFSSEPLLRGSGLIRLLYLAEMSFFYQCAAFSPPYKSAGKMNSATVSRRLAFFFFLLAASLASRLQIPFLSRMRGRCFP